MYSSLKAIFPLGARLFSSLKAQVPPELTSGLEQKFKGLEFKDVKADYETGKIAKGAKEMVEWLGDKAKSGDADAANFLKSITEFKQPEVTGLILQGISKNAVVMRYFSDLVAAAIDSGFTERVSDVVFGRDRNDIDAHSDGSHLRQDQPRVVLSTLIGAKSNGKIRTYTMDINEISQELNPKTREILNCPVFGYINDGDPRGERLQLESKILGKNKDGVLHVRYAYGLRHKLRFDAEKTNFSATEIKKALEEMDDTVEKFHQEGRVESFYIKEDMMFTFKNLERLHGRDKSSLDYERMVLFCGYMKPSREIEGGATGLKLQDSNSKAQEKLTINI